MRTPAEVAAVLRFRGHAVRHGGAESIEVELDHGGAARRLVAYLDELFDARVTLRTLEADRAGKPGRHLVVIDRGIAEVYRRTGDKPFKSIDDVISREELAALSESYKRVAGYDKERLKTR